MMLSRHIQATSYPILRCRALPWELKLRRRLFLQEWSDCGIAVVQSNEKTRGRGTLRILAAVVWACRRKSNGTANTPILTVQAVKRGFLHCGEIEFFLIQES